MEGNGKNNTFQIEGINNSVFCIRMKTEKQGDRTSQQNPKCKRQLGEAHSNKKGEKKTSIRSEAKHGKSKGFRPPVLTA